MKVLYFAFLRERLNRGSEDVAPPPEVKTVGDLLDWMSARDESVAEVFADRSVVRAAVNEEIVTLDAPITDAATVAFFPPMTGG